MATTIITPTQPVQQEESALAVFIGLLLAIVAGTLIFLYVLPQWMMTNGATDRDEIGDGVNLTVPAAELDPSRNSTQQQPAANAPYTP